MKRWAFVTVLLYALTLLLVTVPLLLLAMGNWWGRNGMSATDALELYKQWGYWVCLGVMVLGAGLMLVVPVDVSQKRFVPQRKLLVPVVTAAFLFANVFFAGIYSFASAIVGDEAFRSLEFLGDSGNRPTYALILVIALLWAVWAWVFYRLTRADAPDALTARLKRWLLRGSILELLVAIPSHVIVRNKEVCCA
ncbi:MAG: hypothetical protein NTZ16_01010, partial [Verrucomicrobia bacterium]|nr:hypothetical protein [Verrucomicrobiota bacterium]